MYTFSNTEKNNYKASDFETKSLLYLIAFRPDRRTISLVAIDCFNDLTGINEELDKLWDVQSKGEANLTPFKIGKYFFTLYKNYDSELEFYEYIFFMPPLKASYLKDGVRSIYNASDFEDKYKARIKDGLITEIDRSGLDINQEPIDDFLSKVVLVEDRKNKSTYVKKVLDFESKSSKHNSFYEAIFDEIKTIQTGKKNSLIEGVEINSISEILSYKRHINKSDIHMLIVNRFVGVDLFNQRMMPPSFVGETEGLDIEDIHDLIQDCKASISRAFFNKNSKKEFWKVFDHIISSINKDNSISIREIYESIDSGVLARMSLLSEGSVLFLSALIKDGMIYDN